MKAPSRAVPQPARQPFGRIVQMIAESPEQAAQQSTRLAHPPRRLAAAIGRKRRAPRVATALAIELELKPGARPALDAQVPIVVGEMQIAFAAHR